MKKLLITIGLVLTMTVVVSAQNEGGGLTAKGFKAGIGLANFSGADSDGAETKSGIMGGAFLTFGLSPQFSIQPEVLFVMKGSKVGDGGFELKWKQNYIEVPVLFKYTIPTEGNVKPFLLAGPAVSVLMSADLEMMGLSADIKDVIKSTDFGIAFGGGVDIKTESMTVIFDLRYTMGMSKVVDATEFNRLVGADPGDWDYLAEDPDLKNTNISFMVGLGF